MRAASCPSWFFCRVFGLGVMTWPSASAYRASTLADLRLFGLGAASELSWQIGERAIRVYRADDVLASGCALGSEDHAPVPLDHFLVLRFFGLNSFFDGFFFIGLEGFRIDFFIPRTVNLLSFVDVSHVRLRELRVVAGLA